MVLLFGDDGCADGRWHPGVCFTDPALPVWLRALCVTVHSKTVLTLLNLTWPPTPTPTPSNISPKWLDGFSAENKPLLGKTLFLCRRVVCLAGFKEPSGSAPLRNHRSSFEHLLVTSLNCHHKLPKTLLTYEVLRGQVLLARCHPARCACHPASRPHARRIQKTTDNAAGGWGGLGVV